MKKAEGKHLWKRKEIKKKKKKNFVRPSGRANRAHSQRAQTGRPPVESVMHHCCQSRAPVLLQRAILPQTSNGYAPAHYIIIWFYALWPTCNQKKSTLTPNLTLNRTWGYYVARFRILISNCLEFLIIRNNCEYWLWSSFRIIARRT